MNLPLFIFILFLSSCASNERVLDAAEMQKLGLTAMIYDAPICPTTVDKQTGQSIVTGPCELVTCENLNEKLICKAVKQPKNLK